MPGLSGWLLLLGNKLFGAFSAAVIVDCQFAAFSNEPLNDRQPQPLASASNNNPFSS